MVSNRISSNRVSFAPTDVLVGIEPGRDVPGILVIFAACCVGSPDHIGVVREELVRTDTHEGSIYVVDVAINLLLLCAGRHSGQVRVGERSV